MAPSWPSTGSSTGPVGSHAQSFPELCSTKVFPSPSRPDGVKGGFRRKLVHSISPHFLLSSPFKQMGVWCSREASVRMENKIANPSGFCYSKPKSSGENAADSQAKSGGTERDLPPARKVFEVGRQTREGGGGRKRRRQEGEERGERSGVWETRGAGSARLPVCGSAGPREEGGDTVGKATTWTLRSQAAQVQPEAVWAEGLAEGASCLKDKDPFHCVTGGLA